MLDRPVPPVPCSGMDSLHDVGRSDRFRYLPEPVGLPRTVATQDARPDPEPDAVAQREFVERSVG